jgi:hypothetical protein
MKTLNQQRDLMKIIIPSLAKGPEKDNNSIQQRDLMKIVISISKGPKKISISINKRTRDTSKVNTRGI